jgi:hypothetical protein
VYLYRAPFESSCPSSAYSPYFLDSSIMLISSFVVLFQLTSLELQYVSPKLLMCRDFELCVPGTYYPNQPIINIHHVQSSLQVITSKQRPRKLSIFGKCSLIDSLNLGMGCNSYDITFCAVHLLHCRTDIWTRQCELYI